MKTKGITIEELNSLSFEDKAYYVRQWEGNTVLHFKGDMYLVLDVVRNAVTNEWYVSYKALYGSCAKYVRHVDDFIAWVADREDNITGNKVRFEPVLINSKAGKPVELL